MSKISTIIKQLENGQKGTVLAVFLILYSSVKCVRISYRSPKHPKGCFFHANFGIFGDFGTILEPNSRPIIVDYYSFMIFECQN